MQCSSLSGVCIPQIFLTKVCVKLSAEERLHVIWEKHFHVKAQLLQIARPCVYLQKECMTNTSGCAVYPFSVSPIRLCRRRAPWHLLGNMYVLFVRVRAARLSQESPVHVSHSSMSQACPWHLWACPCLSFVHDSGVPLACQSMPRPDWLSGYVVEPGEEPTMLNEERPSTLTLHLHEQLARGRDVLIFCTCQAS